MSQDYVDSRVLKVKDATDSTKMVDLVANPVTGVINSTIDETTGLPTTPKTRNGVMLTNDVEMGGQFVGFSGSCTAGATTVAFGLTAMSVTVVSDDSTVPSTGVFVSINSDDVFVPLMSKGNGVSWENTLSGITQIKVKSGSGAVNYVGYYQKLA